MSKIRILAATLCVVGSAFPFHSFGEPTVRYWSGATDQTWATASNWTNGVPENGDDIVLLSGDPPKSVPNGTVIRNITALNKAQWFTFGGTFTLTGDITHNGPYTSGYYFYLSSANITLSEGEHSFDANTADFRAMTLTLSGPGSLVKKGPRIFLSDSNAAFGNFTFSGGFRVEEGTFILGTDRMMPNVTNVTVTGSASQLTLNGAGLNTAAPLWISDGGKVSIAAGVTQTVATLTIDGVARHAGTWGIRGSGADYYDSHFLGDGILVVSSGEGEGGDLSTAPQTCVYISSTTSNCEWSKPANWENGLFPVAGDNVVISNDAWSTPKQDISKPGFFIGNLTYRNKNSVFHLTEGLTITGNVSVWSTTTANQQLHSGTLTITEGWHTFDCSGSGPLDFVNTASLAGPGSVVKTGSQYLGFAKGCSFTGEFVVSGGAVKLNIGASWTNCPKVTVTGSGAQLMLTTNTTASAKLSTKTDVYIANAGKLDLGAGIAEPIRSLYLDGNRKGTGTYGSTASAAQHKNNTYFTGAGVLTVTDGGGLLVIFK